MIAVRPLVYGVAVALAVWASSFLGAACTEKTEPTTLRLQEDLMNPRLSLESLRIAPRAPSERPPLLLLLHGVGANEQDLATLAPHVDPRFIVDPHHVRPDAAAV